MQARLFRRGSKVCLCRCEISCIMRLRCYAIAEHCFKTWEQERVNTWIAVVIRSIPLLRSKRLLAQAVMSGRVCVCKSSRRGMKLTAPINVDAARQDHIGLRSANVFSVGMRLAINRSKSSDGCYRLVHSTALSVSSVSDSLKMCRRREMAERIITRMSV